MTVSAKEWKCRICFRGRARDGSHACVVLSKPRDRLPLFEGDRCASCCPHLGMQDAELCCFKYRIELADLGKAARCDECVEEYGP